MTKRYKKEFKKQIITLNDNGKKISEIVEEYGVFDSKSINGKKIITTQIPLKPKIIELTKKKN